MNPPRNRKLRTGGRHLAVVGAFLAALTAQAASIATPPPPSPALGGAAPTAVAPNDAPLPKLVAELARKEVLNAEDCARLAQETIAHGQGARQAGQPAQPGVVGDGLAAVERGESLDAHAANWPDLRKQLEELLQPPPQQDQQKQDEQKKDEEQKNEQQQQQEQQQQDRKNQDEKSDDQQQQQQEKQQQEQQKQEQQQSEEQKSEQQKQDQKDQQQQQSEAQQQQAKPDESRKDTQKIGGEQEPDDERREHPELAVPLQKLDEVRDQDSPAKLFQLLQNDEPRAPDQPKKDW